MQITVLLTTTVTTQKHITWLKQRDNNESLNMYLKKINKWLANTNLNVVVVENSGYNFTEVYNNLPNEYKHRIEFVSFTYDDPSVLPDVKQFLNNNGAKGHHELYSINHAYNNSKLLKNSDYIVKVTGRYFIPDLEKLLTNAINNDKNIKVIRQSRMWRGWNRCEVLGCHSSVFNDFFKFPLSIDMAEEEYMNRGNKIGNIYNIPEMKLDEPTMQGVGVVQNTL